MRGHFIPFDRLAMQYRRDLCEIVYQAEGRKQEKLHQWLTTGQFGDGPAGRISVSTPGDYSVTSDILPKKRNGAPHQGKNPNLKGNKLVPSYCAWPKLFGEFWILRICILKRLHLSRLRQQKPIRSTNSSLCVCGCGWVVRPSRVAWSQMAQILLSKI